MHPTFSLSYEKVDLGKRSSELIEVEVGKLDYLLDDWCQDNNKWEDADIEELEENDEIASIDFEDYKGNQRLLGVLIR